MPKTMTRLEDYASRYETIVFEREDGILQMRLHTGGGDYVNGSVAHTEIVDAFRHIAADHGNRIVILTGTGSTFGASVGHDMEADDGEQVARIHYEGRSIMHAVLEVECPMIAAINGPMTHLPPFALTADITICSENATFSDQVHFTEAGVVPGDGVQTVWQYLLGPNRGRYLLLTGQVLSAREALSLGVVNEVLAAERLLPRAWEIARELNRRSHPTLRYSRLAMNQHYRRLIFDDVTLGYGVQWLGIKTGGRGVRDA